MNNASGKPTNYLDKYFHHSERKSYFEQGKLYSVEIEVTNGCQMNCHYCYNETVRGQERNRQIFGMRLPLLMNLVDDLADLGVRMIYWLGGEPLLRQEKLLRLLDYSAARGIKNILVTNGIALTPKVCRQIAPLCETVSYHLDTVDPRLFQQLQAEKIDQRTAGRLHSKSIHGIQRLLDTGYDPQKLELNITLTAPVMKTAKETMDWAANELGVRTIILLVLRLIGNASKLSPDQVPDKDSIREIFHYRAKLLQSPELLRIGTMDFGKYYCLTNCYVRFDGVIKPCSYITETCGYLHRERESFRQMLDDNFERLTFGYCMKGTRNNIKGKCGTCKNSEYCFGCRANAYWFAGHDLRASDPTCWLNKEQMRISSAD